MLNPNAQAILDVLNRHLASLAWVDCTVDSDGNANRHPRIFCTSGFVVVYKGEWLWVTAGHLLKAMDNDLPALQRRIVQCQFLAGWDAGTGTVGQIKFDYANCIRFFVDDDAEGEDLGLIYLDATARHDLEQAGLKPLTNFGPPPDHAEEYWMHGLPEAEQRDEIEESENGIDVATSVVPVIFQVDRLDESGGFAETKRKRFIASIPAEVPLTTLNGISGGPIYAIKQYPDRRDFHLVGVQNMERKISRTIASCPSDLLLELLDKGFAGIQRQLGVTPPGSGQS